MLTLGCLTEPKVERLYYKTEHYDILYTDRKDGRKIVDKERANLVSSCCTNDLHAPALDFDFPVTFCGILKEDELEPPTLLSLEKATKKYQYFTVLRRLIEFGFVEYTFYDTAKNLYGPDDSTNIHTDMIIKNPLLEISTYMKIVPSSSKGHFHLYLESAVCTWDQYLELLTVMKEAGWIDEGFVDRSKTYKRSFLLKPGITRDDIKDIIRC
jgi:hypothetical protein